MSPFGWITKASIAAIVVGLSVIYGMEGVANRAHVQGPHTGLVMHFEASQGQTGARSQFPNRGLELNLKEGQISKIPGTDLTIDVRRVRDFTSEGCLGGPVGCPDQVQLAVIEGKEKKEITLYVAHAQSQKEQRVNQAHLFGHKIELVSLKGVEITLSIESAR